jgi:sugar lactone lactonase YvrE
MACLLGGLSPCSAQNVTVAPTIATVAGNGTQGHTGDGGSATSAELAGPGGMALDSAGNLYIADYYNNVVRKVDTSGNISTFAGNGTQGYSGDGGPATSAELYYPAGVALDSAGNLYIADSRNSVIRKVDHTSGNITTFAGNHTNGHSGDGGPATSAQLYWPDGVALDSAGNVYIAEIYNSDIRKVDHTSGNISTFAGNGVFAYSGDGGPATSAALNEPGGMALDSAGNVYIADTNNSVIRKVDSSGIIHTFAGNGGFAYSGDGGPATSAALQFPIGVALDSAGNLYIADTSNNVVRKVDTAGIIHTVAGSGAFGYSGDGGPAASAALKGPDGVVLDRAGNLYIADSANNVIRKVNNAPANFGQVNVGASSAQSVYLSINTALTLTSVQASGDYSVLSNSCSLNASLPSGTFCKLQVQFAPTRPGQRWFALAATDSGSSNYSFGLEGIGVGSALAFTPGITGTFAGNHILGYSGDGGPATSAELNVPFSVALDSAGNLYIADNYNNLIRKVDTSGNIHTVAGNGTAGYSGDGGPATSAALYYPRGVALDSAGNLYIADTANNVIRKVDTGGNIHTVAGIADGFGGYYGDGGPAISAHLSGPYGVALDSVGNLYIADTLNKVIRKVDTSSIIHTVAGNGTAGYSGDGGPATSAEFFSPVRVTPDSAGNLYIADPQMNVIRKVDTIGVIHTVVGNGVPGYSGDGGPAASAELYFPYDLALDSAGNLYIPDSLNNVMRMVDASGNIHTVAGDGGAGYSGDGGPATGAQLNNPLAVAVDSAGNLYIADSQNSVIRKVNVTSSALSFGSLYVGQSSTFQSVVASNVGNAPLAFYYFAISPNFQLPIVGENCIPLNPGSNTCSVAALFAPQTAGNPLTGSITVTDNAFNSPHTVDLRGVGLQLSVTIGTSPNGLAFSIDGIPYMPSKVLNWKVGDTHMIATTTPQILTSGASAGGYTFNSWSDSGAISHQVTASTSTTSYTATFTKTAILVPTTQLTVRLRTTRHNKNTGVSTFAYTITNNSTTASIPGPVQVLMTNPTTGAVNNSGTAAGYPYWTINSSIPPKTTVGLTIQVVTPPTTIPALSIFSGHF